MSVADTTTRGERHGRLFRRRSRHHAGAIPRGEARGGQGSAVRPRYDPRPTSPRQPVSSHCGRARIRGLALRPPGALRAPRASRRAIVRFNSSRREVARAIAPSYRVNWRTPRAPRAPRRAPRQRLQINPTREEHRDRPRPTDLPVSPVPPSLRSTGAHDPGPVYKLRLPPEFRTGTVRKGSGALGGSAIEPAAELETSCYSRPLRKPLFPRILGLEAQRPQRESLLDILFQTPVN